MYKNDWAKINEMIPGRTPIQLHCRFNSFIKANHLPWTEAEDIALLEQVRLHGLGDWVLVASELGNTRTRAQLRQRFLHIYRNFKKCPALGLRNTEYR